MADILGLIKGNSQKINLDNLADLCSKKNVWDHFNMNKKDFFDLSDSNQRQLTSKFYFDNVNNQPSIDESISNIMKNSDGVNLTKIFDNGKNRTEMSISTEKKSKVKRSQDLRTCGKMMDFFKAIAATSSLKRRICSKIPFFM